MIGLKYYHMSDDISLLTSPYMHTLRKTTVRFANHIILVQLEEIGTVNTSVRPEGRTDGQGHTSVLISISCYGE